MRTFVIAEAGISHDGDIDKAMKLIDVAREAKADAVKFQTFNAVKLAERRKNPALADILKQYEMPLTWLPQLKKHCDAVGIEFMTTCFDEETIPIVAPFVNRFKVSAAESHDEKFVRAHYRHGKETIVSSYDAVNYYPPGTAKPVRTLHCVGKYPTPLADVKLEICCLDGIDGFSDHTRHIMMGSWAVAAGASIVEVHFCGWQTNWDNPDRPVSHCPSDLIRYVEWIRAVEVALYGQASAEPKTESPAGCAPHTFRPPPAEGFVPFVDPREVSSLLPSTELPLPGLKNSPQGDPHV